MTDQKTYFTLARNEEKAGNKPAALNFYLSSFCASCNLGEARQAGTVEKIRRLQTALSIPDDQLFEMVRSYGVLSDSECRNLLFFAINGYTSGIHSVLSYG